MEMELCWRQIFLFSRFDNNWIQTDTQTSKVFLIMKRHLGCIFQDNCITVLEINQLQQLQITKFFRTFLR